MQTFAGDVETRLDTSNHEVDRPLPIGTNKKVIGLMKNELGGRIIKEFLPNLYSYLTNDGHVDKESKGTKKRLQALDGMASYYLALALSDYAKQNLKEYTQMKN